MNSMSKCNCHEEKEVCCKKEKEVCCKKEKEVCCRKEGTPVLLKCGCPKSVTLPVLALGGLLPTTGITVSTVNVNTEDFCDPCIKFEFASNVNITVGVGLPITLNFQVFKICKNQFTPIPVGPTFTFSQILSVLGSNTFSFFVCDCDACPDDCCTYSVVVTVATLGVALASSITNATLSALVVEGDRC